MYAAKDIRVLVWWVLLTIAIVVGAIIGALWQERKLDK